MIPGTKPENEFSSKCVNQKMALIIEFDIWFRGTLDQGSAGCPALLGRRRRRRHLEAIEVQS